MRRISSLILGTALFFAAAVAPLFSETYASWNAVTDEMHDVLDEAYKIYLRGESDAAKKQVNVAYFQYYEKVGFERTTQAKISGSRAGIVEQQFATVKKVITEKKPAKAVEAEFDKLKTMLREDANKLDPKPYWGNVAEGYSKDLSNAYRLYKRGEKSACDQAFAQIVDRIYNDKEIGFYRKVLKVAKDDAAFIDKKI